MLMGAEIHRPSITCSLTALEFSNWYWLKTELVLICRLFGLGTVGSKLDLELRILDYLSGAVTQRGVSKRRTGKMPAEFTLETTIGDGWRCNPALGRFFRQVCGKGFHFNAAMRDFIHNGAGKTLAEAAACYQATLKSEIANRPISKQLQYNQHFRDFFAANPGATRQDAIKLWWEKRARPNGTRKTGEDQ